ncbi:MAG: serine protease [Minicystis sp.]
MRAFLKAWLWLSLCCCILHCGGGEPAQHGEARSSVVYGEDDRKEPYEYPVDSPLRAWARSSAIMMGTTDLRGDDERELMLGVEQTFSEEMAASGKPLCPEEPFQDEPALDGLCSAFLVAPDVVVTAGHCVVSAGVCPNLAFVFGAGYDQPDRDPRRIRTDDVYFCRDVPALVEDDAQGDYAVVKLDRPVVGREPLPLRRTGKVSDDEELVLIGNPAGLPTKIAAHGAVLDNASPRFFAASVDSYGGNSGSVVMGLRSGLVEGILARGETDFVRQGDCWMSKVCPADGGSCRGEDVTRATEVAPHIPG